jgi:hypothetical protein
LLSLSPRYQQNCPTGRCQIILVDNGSQHPPRPVQFADLGLDLALYHLPKTSDSPVEALNFGLSKATAPLIGVWIDGARMASPGLVDACARAAALHPRPVVATYNCHLGHELQYFSAHKGYNAEAEDKLLQSIAWPEDGYRLFDISTADMIGGPTGRMWESNAIFLPQSLWRELGGYDTRFIGPGGGSANHDLFLRACGSPGVQLIRIQGEATFHQIHGGVSTGARFPGGDILKLTSRDYYRRTGRPLKMVHEIGWLYDSRTGTVDRGG